jgi:hypothetical protein
MADAIVLKSVIHDWDDQPVSNPAKLLPRYSKTWDAAFSSSGLCPTACDEHRSQALSDLNMLRGPGDKERT